jgi:hypothetical protein
VQDKFKGRVGSHKLLIACAVALALFSLVVCIRFYRYAYSTAWHCVHGNHTEIGEHRIRLPILWWKERGSGWNDQSLVERGVVSLVRAYPTGSFNQPRIVVRPASTWEVGATDQEIRESMQSTIAQMNHGSNTGSSYSLVILTLRNHEMYCVRDDLNQFAKLLCRKDAVVIGLQRSCDARERGRVYSLNVRLTHQRIPGS